MFLLKDIDHTGTAQYADQAKPSMLLLLSKKNGLHHSVEPLGKPIQSGMVPMTIEYRVIGSLKES
jgi:hypothetical protein